MMKTLKRMPVPLAILIMVLCIVVGVAFGNHNALRNAKAEPEAILSEVTELASQRAGKGSNLLVVAERNTVDDTSKTALKTAANELKNAKNAGDIAAANGQLTAAANAVNEQIQATAGAEDKRLATAAMDDMESMNMILTRRAGAYNEQVEEVRKVYRKLPFGWLVGGIPEVY